ncbi:MAG TPA: hypothetical protein H9876_04040 [Candidatus Limosilactobacillus merdipullorum]|uniref:Uncharacterized protein n=1 Tax=Candidatus Limosilactobacillus merdipullorum TaxID=2838653 RepID=A0A9D1QQ55_9LACO|nr:hypothetical protein [Candidatus Limosilactobacillus merdipullorum]
MTELTAPQLREILKQGHQYRRAVNLLQERWEVHENQLKYDLVEHRDVNWARLLQNQKLIIGKYDLNSYREVSQLLNRHPEWFSAAGRATLLAPFA